MKKKCLYCYKEFVLPRYTILRRKRDPKSLTGRFCSKLCLNRFKRDEGIGVSGYFKSEEQSGEKNFQWKGDSVSYGALHDWINYHLGSAESCIKCHMATASKYEWANISGEYKRELDDWQPLCKKCHFQSDRHYDKCFKEWNEKPIRKKLSNNKSGYKNVRITKEGRFRAYITIDKKQTQIGNFDTAIKAYEAYKAKALELFNDY